MYEILFKTAVNKNLTALFIFDQEKLYLPSISKAYCL